MALARALVLGRHIVITAIVVDSGIPQHIMEYSFGSSLENVSSSNFVAALQMEFEASSTHSKRAIRTG